jgi:hypothetical protein
MPLRLTQTSQRIKRGRKRTGRLNPQMNGVIGDGNAAASTAMRNLRTMRGASHASGV